MDAKLSKPLSPPLLKEPANRSGWPRTRLGFGGIELPFADHVHRFDVRNECASAAKCFESQHGSHDAFDGLVVLFDDVVEVFDLAHLDVLAGIGLNALDGRRVHTALVNDDLLGHAVQIDGALREALSGGTFLWPAYAGAPARM